MDNVKQRMYLPDYYRKDRLSGNTIGSEELRPFLTDEKKSLCQILCCWILTSL